MFSPAAVIASKVPWLKLIQPVVILLLLAALIWQTNQLGHSRTMLKNEQTARGELATKLKVNDSWRDIRTGVDALVLSVQNQRNALDQISKESLANKERAKLLDRQLDEAQKRNQKQFESSRKTIKELQERPPVSDPVEDYEQIKEDSTVPWRGWTAIVPQEDAVDKFKWTGADFFRTQLNVKIVIHPSYEAMVALWQKGSTGRKLKDDEVLRGFAYPNQSPCEIHVANGKDNRTLGHELMHCMYGSWHS